MVTPSWSFVAALLGRHRLLHLGCCPSRFLTKKRTFQRRAYSAPPDSLARKREASGNSSWQIPTSATKKRCFATSGATGVAARLSAAPRISEQILCWRDAAAATVARDDRGDRTSAAYSTSARV